MSRLRQLKGCIDLLLPLETTFMSINSLHLVVTQLSLFDLQLILIIHYTTNVKIFSSLEYFVVFVVNQ